MKFQLRDDQPLTLAVRGLFRFGGGFQVIGETPFDQRFDEKVDLDRRVFLSEGRSGGKAEAGEVLFRGLNENIGHFLETVFEAQPSGFREELGDPYMFYSVDVLQPLSLGDENPAFFSFPDFLNQWHEAFEIDDPRRQKLMFEEAPKLGIG